MRNIYRHRYVPVARSPFAEELSNFRTSLEAADYTSRAVRRHMIRLDRILREIGNSPGSIYTTRQIRVAVERHNATRQQLVDFRTTQHHFERYLASQCRLDAPVVHDRFADLRARYRRELVEVRGLSGSTTRSHEATVSDFLNRAVGPRRALRELTREDIERFIEVKSRENCRQSLQHIVAAMRAFLRHCHDQGEIPSRLDVIDTPRTYRGELLPRALSWPAIGKLLRSIDRRRRTGERDYAILHLMAHYGLRPSEVTALRVDSIDWHDGVLRVEQRKTRSELLLPLAEVTIRILRRYLDHDRGYDTRKYPELFLRNHCPHRRLTRTAISEMFARRAQASGLARGTYSAYSLRHAFAMRLLQRGVGIKAIGDVLGHRDLESTCVYLRLDVDALRDVALPVPQSARRQGARHA